MTKAQGNRGWAAMMVAAMLMMLAATIAAPAQTFTTLVNFNTTNGRNPYYASLVQGTDGNLYGTVPDGGEFKWGTVFRLSPAGTLTTLYNFCSQTNCTDGAGPSGLVLGTDGSFYGTTGLGGASANGGNGSGWGTVFKITSTGRLTTLYSFCGQVGCNDGQGPAAALVQGMDGSFYGTTFYGGLSGNGTVFRITPGGTLTTLYNFNEYPDGGQPLGSLVQAPNGILYGTTNAGGLNGDGTVYSITSQGALTTIHSFDYSDGWAVNDGLILASDGNFYGTTTGGGSSSACQDGCGTVFKITASGKLTTLHNFDSIDGAEPIGGLVQATDGDFYGTTGTGGTGYACPYQCGTVFEITRSGTLTTLHSFDSTDGATPYDALFQATNGSFYGTTLVGGTSQGGTIFAVSVGLGAFVETVPTTAKVGRTIRILGNNLTGATSVTFNGTAATFTVKSATYISTTVPTGATTGPVQVVTPSGTLTSNVNFRVE
ncbi:MAG TPA: choice-of-anchor tandem repeat GloVer-containing protein [Terriglobia bacterium]|nr:choice-of-anchor tandem repeat GloVer-containing protein [Terriglobia bacterium]